MVASVAALTSSAQAASYYEADDYYAEGGLAPSAWAGKGAEALGVEGEVDRTQFRDLLDGKVAGQQLGTIRDGQLEHRPGWDVTLSAPKSVSIMAEVAGDRRLVEAHSAAVKTALGLIEAHMAATRIREGGAVMREATGNLVVASFQHGTSRAQDPQLHTHNVILNATQDENGTWRSLEPRAIYQLQKQIGAIYRQELAHNVRALGYEIDTAKDSMFEIKGVSNQVMTAFSTRSTEIEARLDARGTNRDAASAAEKQIAALDTRQAKQHVNQAALVQDWHETANSAGFGVEARLALMKAAQTQAADPLHKAILTMQGEAAATRAVAQAAEKLGERQSVFAAHELQEVAGRFGLGKASHAHIAQAIEQSTKFEVLLTRTYADRRGAEFSGFTTRVNVELETKMLAIEAQGRGALKPLASQMNAAKAVERAASQAERSGYSWNNDQREAIAQLLTSPNRITALQGYAGTAKTTTVLATFAREVEASGTQVIALAPTASAALVLSEALGTRGDTVARHLLSPERTEAGKAAVWIVDEASLLSARDTAKLFVQAEKLNARVILVGDVKQLGSVEAGAAFAQLQTSGMETAKLGEIVRQTNAATKEAVQATIEGDAKKALAALDRGGGRIIEQVDRAERFTTIAQDYAALDKATRAKTLVIDPSREGRDVLTAEIRAELARSGALTGPAVEMHSLVVKGLTRAEARDPLSYDKGDIVRFTRDYADKDIARGVAYRVDAIDPAKSAIALKAEDGREIDWRLRQWGAGKAQAFSTQSLELKSGDRIQFTRNDRDLGRINGQRAEVTSIDIQARTATLKLARGKTQTLNLDNSRDGHVRHAYVETAFAAQGRTADHVMIHADSAATNLVDQKSFYVGVSRAKQSVAVYTNDRAKLVTAINQRAGVTQTAISQMPTPVAKAAKVMGAGLG